MCQIIWLNNIDITSIRAGTRSDCDREWVWRKNAITRRRIAFWTNLDLDLFLVFALSTEFDFAWVAHWSLCHRGGSIARKHNLGVTSAFGVDPEIVKNFLLVPCVRAYRSSFRGEIQRGLESKSIFTGKSNGHYVADNGLSPVWFIFIDTKPPHINVCVWTIVNIWRLDIKFRWRLIFNLQSETLSRIKNTSLIISRSSASVTSKIWSQVASALSFITFFAIIFVSK